MASRKVLMRRLALFGYLGALGRVLSFDRSALIRFEKLQARRLRLMALLRRARMQQDLIGLGSEAVERVVVVEGPKPTPDQRDEGPLIPKKKLDLNPPQTHLHRTKRQNPKREKSKRLRPKDLRTTPRTHPQRQHLLLLQQQHQHQHQQKPTK